MTERAVAIGLFGLGEAGTPIATDLVNAGANLKAYDPAPVTTPEGVIRVDRPQAVVDSVDLVMAITSAASSQKVLEQVLHNIAPNAVYADLATAAPGLEVRLAASAASVGIPFADVALMAPVPGRGLAVPSLASGAGAARYAQLINGLGGQVEAIGDEAGHASARKLMRSIVTKGLSALLIESMALASARNDSEWLWDHLVAELGSMSEEFMARLLTGPANHAERRIEEMEAAQEMLAESGLEAPMTRATVERLRLVLAAGVPDLPTV